MCTVKMLKNIDATQRNAANRATLQAMPPALSCPALPCPAVPCCMARRKPIERL